jgi:hypothetical protein
LPKFDVCYAGSGWRSKGAPGQAAALRPAGHRWWLSRQALPAGGDFWGDEKRSDGVGARQRAS